MTAQERPGMGVEVRATTPPVEYTGPLTRDQQAAIDSVGGDPRRPVVIHMAPAAPPPGYVVREPTVDRTIVSVAAIIGLVLIIIVMTVAVSCANTPPPPVPPPDVEPACLFMC